MLKSTLLALAALSLLAGISAAAPAAAPSPAPATAVTSEPAPAAGQKSTADQTYILGPADVIEVEVLGRADFKARARIDQDGTIQVPYLGSIVAANQTVEQLGNQISKALQAGGYFSNPIMRVEVVSYSSRYVTVLGHVASPGLVPVDRPYHLSEILARVGGVREGAADYVIVRSDKGPERRLMVATLAVGDTSQDPYVSPGDKIFSPKADMFYISGQVRAPGAYPLEVGMTLRMAIARGGGLTDMGNEKGAKVTGPDGKRLKIALDEKIGAGDVIVIGERLF